MIDKDDTLFDYLTGAEERFSVDNILYLGWYGKGAEAFKQYADAYSYSADVLYNKFVDVGRDFAHKDRLALTLLFLYRHYCELIIKYLYFKYLRVVQQFESEEEYLATVKSYFERNQHMIVPLWNELLPIIAPLRKRVKADVSIEAITSYLQQIDRFDSSSMTMRYPVQKDLSPMIDGHIKIDIVNFHEKMVCLVSEIAKLDEAIDNQIVKDYPKEDLEICFQALKRHKAEYDTFLQKVHNFQLAEEAHNTPNAVENLMNPHPEIVHCRSDYYSFVSSLSDESFRLLEAIYYTGRSIISEEIHLPPKKDNAFFNVLTCLIHYVKLLGNGDCMLSTPYSEGEREACPFYHYRKDCLLKHIGCIMTLAEPYLKLDTIIE